MRETWETKRQIVLGTHHHVRVHIPLISNVSTVTQAAHCAKHNQPDGELTNVASLATRSRRHHARAFGITQSGAPVSKTRLVSGDKKGIQYDAQGAGRAMEISACRPALDVSLHG